MFFRKIRERLSLHNSVSPENSDRGEADLSPADLALLESLSDPTTTASASASASTGASGASSSSASSSNAGDYSGTRRLTPVSFVVERDEEGPDECEGEYDGEEHTSNASHNEQKMCQSPSRIEFTVDTEIQTDSEEPCLDNLQVNSQCVGTNPQVLNKYYSSEENASSGSNSHRSSDGGTEKAIQVIHVEQHYHHHHHHHHHLHVEQKPAESLFDPEDRVDDVVEETAPKVEEKKDKKKKGKPSKQKEPHKKAAPLDSVDSRRSSDSSLIESSDSFQSDDDDEYVDFVDMLRGRSKSVSISKSPAMTPTRTTSFRNSFSAKSSPRLQSEACSSESSHVIHRKSSSADILSSSAVKLPKLLFSQSFNHLLVELPDSVIFDTIDHFRKCAPNPESLRAHVPKNMIFRILSHAAKSCSKLQNIIEYAIDSGPPVTICGDIHGNFFDLLNVFKMNNYPSSERPYIFNGDLVDRGPWGIETLITILMFHIRFPNHVYIIRGNHESRRCTEMYGFRNEVKFKYDSQVYDACMDLFDVLPIAALVKVKGKSTSPESLGEEYDSNVFIVHGGLYREEYSNRVGTMDGLRKVNRVGEPENLLVLDALWSDPCCNQTAYMRPNTRRGLGVEFGLRAVSDFMKQNNVRIVVRSHQNPTSNTGSSVLPGEGYDLHLVHKKHFLITVFSIPNYLGGKNKGAVMILFPDATFSIRSFGPATRPPIPIFNVSQPDEKPKSLRKGSSYAESSMQKTVN